MPGASPRARCEQPPFCLASYSSNCRKCCCIMKHDTIKADVSRACRWAGPECKAEVSGPRVQSRGQQQLNNQSSRSRSPVMCRLNCINERQPGTGGQGGAGQHPGARSAMSRRAAEQPHAPAQHQPASRVPLSAPLGPRPSHPRLPALILLPCTQRPPTSSMGMTWLYPPPAAPPLMPKVGPWLGWRTHAMAVRPTCAPSAWHSPMVVVLLPSPSGVGVMPATSTAGAGGGPTGGEQGGWSRREERGG